MNVKQQIRTVLRHANVPQFATSLSSILHDWNSLKSTGAKLTSLQEQTPSPHEDIGLDPRIQISKVSELSSKQSQSTQSKRLQLLHTIAHIEYSAVVSYSSLFLMAKVEQLPLEYFEDIGGVVADECRHFLLLQNLLERDGMAYPSMPVNKNILGDLEKSRGELLDRLALVSLVHEAKGLDAGDRLVQKLASLGCKESTAALELIVREERNHVRTGVKWFEWMCENYPSVSSGAKGNQDSMKEQKLDPEVEFKRICSKFGIKFFEHSINMSARKEAGFPPAWLPL